MRDIPTSVALVRIVREVEAGGVVTPAAIAERYAVSLRTAQRWLADISREIVPLVRKGPPTRPGTYRKGISE